MWMVLVAWGGAEADEAVVSGVAGVDDVVVSGVAGALYGANEEMSWLKWRSVQIPSKRAHSGLLPI
ncbi:hypothetical protein DDD63_01865 [Actinobaculum sp. 313]|nr:hypothetical protein DDD63_01865 [Actinobaculum sp. 313]